jgi:hypothetical protein
LTDKVTRWKALATGDCRHCKNKVFDEADVSTLVFRGLKRQEFKLTFESISRQTNRRVIQLLVLYFCTMAGSVPLMRYFQRLVDSGELDWVTWADWKAIARIILVALVLFSLAIVIFARLGTHPARFLPCPECGRSLIGPPGKITLETGVCIYCGCRLFEVPSAEKS